MKKILLIALRAYKLFVSPLLGTQCRFAPSCSDYCAHAVSEYGTIKGSLLGIRRVLRCNPFFTSRFDPVPTKK